MATNPKSLYSATVSVYNALGVNPSEEELRFIAPRMYYACFHHLGAALNIPDYRKGKRHQSGRDKRNKIIYDSSGKPKLDSYHSAHKVLKCILFDNQSSRPKSFNHLMTLVSLREDSDYDINCTIPYHRIHRAKRAMDDIFNNK